MKDINSIFLELKYEIAKIELVNSILDSVLALFALLIFNLFFRMPLLYVLIGVGSFFVIDLIVRVMLIDLRDIEKKNSVVRDILRTANDYRGYFRDIKGKPNEEKLLVQGMYSDFAKQMKHVRTETFININAFFKKTTLAIFLAFLIVFSSVVSIDVEEALVKVDQDVKAAKGPGSGDIIHKFDDELKDIYGEKNDIISLDDQIDVDIASNLFQLDLSKKQSFKLEEFQGYDEFYDESMEEDEQFVEDISDLDRDLVKAYFTE